MDNGSPVQTVKKKSFVSIVVSERVCVPVSAWSLGIARQLCGNQSNVYGLKRAVWCCSSAAWNGH